jgi:hypothetical protein
MFGDERGPNPALMTDPSMPTIERATLSVTRHIRVAGR